MKQLTFKAGDFVYSIQQGWITLENRETNSEYKLGKLDDQGYTVDGKFLTDDLNRSLFLPEEAKALGIEIPKRKVVKEVWVNMYSVNKRIEAGTFIHLTKDDAENNQFANSLVERLYLGAHKISVEVEE